VHLWQLGRSIWLPYPVLCQHQRSWSSGSMKVPRVNVCNDISMTWFAYAMAVIGSDDTIFLDPGVKQVIACRPEPVSPSFCTPADCGRSCYGQAPMSTPRISTWCFRSPVFCVSPSQSI
jgi:hypothetical protein